MGKFTVGNVIRFAYAKNDVLPLEERSCSIEVVKMSAGNPFVGPRPVYITGWDSTVNGYRTFSVEKIRPLIIENYA